MSKALIDRSWIHLAKIFHFGYDKKVQLLKIALAKINTNLSQIEKRK
jgi:hypothetical protein